MSNPAIVKSLIKALKVLECFLEDENSKGVSEIAKKLELPKSTVSNILATFQSEGYVESDRNSGKYKLGLRALELSGHTYQANSVRQILQPYMESLAEKTREEILLATPSNFDVIYIGATLFQQGSSRRFVIGSRAPMYCTGIGKALLFEAGDEKIREIFAGEVAKFTQNTITSYNEFIKVLNTARERGYSVDNMEHEYGIKCVAVPIRSQSGEIVAGLSISGPSLRMTDDIIEKYAEDLIEISRAVRKYII